jgi:hypothetical protein
MASAASKIMWYLAELLTKHRRDEISHGFIRFPTSKISIAVSPLSYVWDTSTKPGQRRQARAEMLRGFSRIGR